MSRFEPVHLPLGRRLQGKVSQTMLRHYNSCPRSGYLYALYKGEASTPEMERGKALHAVAERSIHAMIAQGEPMVPPEVVKAITNEVLADPEFAVPIEEHDFLREACYRLGSELTIDPAAVVAVETLYVLDIGGYQVRCRIDFAQLLEGGAVVYVADFKSSRAAPSFEDVSRKRRDGTLSAKHAQLVLYALVLAFGVPVRIEPCEVCGGMVLTPAARAAGSLCNACDNRGYQEIPEPFPVAGRAQRFDLEFVFPGIEDRDGKMLRRPVTLTRLELEEYRASLEGLLARLAHSEESGDWPAVAGSHCVECPAQSECPIPAELRDHAGTINTVEQAQEAAEKLDREAAEHKARREELKRFAKAREVPIRFGADQVLEFGYTESERIVDKDAMWADLDRARRFGDPFDKAKYVKVVKSTPFKQRTLSADELAEEAIGGSDE